MSASLSASFRNCKNNESNRKTFYETDATQPATTAIKDDSNIITNIKTTTMTDNGSITTGKQNEKCDLDKKNVYENDDTAGATTRKLFNKNNHINHLNISIDNTINNDMHNNINTNNFNNNNSSIANNDDYHKNAEKSSSSGNCSPNISRHSPTISMCSINENDIDSSVIDSDSSEFDQRSDRIRSSVYSKKLGESLKRTATTDLPKCSELNLNPGLQVVNQNIQQQQQQQAATINHLDLPAKVIESSTMKTSQFGTISLTNSSNVTFGDKHFYEGPVTIQQFLIDNPTKWTPKDQNGQDNPLFDENNATATTAAAATNDNLDAGSKINMSSTSKQDSLYKFVFNKKSIIITGTIVLFTLLVIIFIAVASGQFNKIAQNPDPTDNNSAVNRTYKLVTRQGWLGRAPTGKLDAHQLPAIRAVISHTASEPCFDDLNCAQRVRDIQDYHMDSNGWDDIGYNFLIGGNGKVYVGRGWDFVGAHTKGYNYNSTGISFIGTFTHVKPTIEQINAAKLLMDEGVKSNKLIKDYKIYGARQLSATESPGSKLYEIIKTWTHWSDEI